LFSDELGAFTPHYFTDVAILDTIIFQRKDNVSDKTHM